MMIKFLWVGLPLAGFAAWVVLRRLLARPLSRQAVNVQQSVLLLAYFAATSGLGIFWVANQQLPVFDLHYLFGYATVLLVVVHLAFNWRIVWAHFTRRRAKAGVSATGAKVPTRSGWPRGAVVAGGAAALGFLLGTRYGGGDLRATWSTGAAASQGSEAAGARAPAGAGPIEVVERYHQFSSHDRLGVLTRAPSVDWGPTPEPFKVYQGRPSIDLPTRMVESSGDSVSRAMMGAAEMAATSLPPRLDIARLGTLLFHSVGVTVESGGFKLRAAPSSGALFPSEVYVAARAVDGLSAGLYHYDPDRHRLTRLGEFPRAARDLGLADPAASRAPALLALTSVFRRTGHKYRDRAYRYAVADAGHALENVRVAGAALGLMARPLRQFDEARAAGTLGIDGIEEGVLALVSLEEAAPEDGTGPVRFRWPPDPETSPGALGVTGFVHLATSLRFDESRVGAAGASPEGVAPPPGSVMLLPPRPALGRALETIAARRSVRRFRAEPLTLAELSSMLHYAGRAPAPLSAAVRIYVVAHAVEGVEPGAYRYEPASHALVPTRRGDLRAASEAAALAQEAIGRAAAVFVLALDRAAAFATDGARGYRHGYLEAGMLGERIYLEAGGRGLGACAVGAFFDDEAARLVGVDPARAWVVHFAA
ncbi:MAG TPA: SagB/ThcOx family dehydrogenase, partial [Isosphaeraceae bacterium]